MTYVLEEFVKVYVVVDFEIIFSKVGCVKGDEKGGSLSNVAYVDFWIVYEVEDFLSLYADFLKVAEVEDFLRVFWEVDSLMI